MGEASDNVLNLQQKLKETHGLVVDQQQMVYGGRSLNASDVLGACGLLDESTIFLTLGLDGAKKRKKKTYSKPKKLKHKRKKTKLTVLKFYKVGDENKVVRLRKECPNSGCGPGVFMAMHHNRYYCGKCGLTYMIKKNE